MRYTVILHIANEDPVVAELDGLPGPTDTSVAFLNPRRRDGKPVHYFTSGLNSVIFPWHRITFIEVMSGGREKKEEVVDFFRES